MNKNLLYGFSGVIVGALLGGGIMWASMSGGVSSHHSSLAGKHGDAFDRAFLETMIQHHEGALEMAEQAEKSAKHDEIKRMAKDIALAQSKEITIMKQWQVKWHYEKNEVNTHHR